MLLPGQLEWRRRRRSTISAVGCVDDDGVAAWAVKEVLITVAKDFAWYIRLCSVGVCVCARGVRVFFLSPPSTRPQTHSRKPFPPVVVIADWLAATAAATKQNAISIGKARVETLTSTHTHTHYHWYEDHDWRTNGMGGLIARSKKKIIARCFFFLARNDRLDNIIIMHRNRQSS